MRLLQKKEHPIKQAHGRDSPEYDEATPDLNLTLQERCIDDGRISR